MSTFFTTQRAALSEELLARGPVIAVKLAGTSFDATKPLPTLSPGDNVYLLEGDDSLLVYQVPAKLSSPEEERRKPIAELGLTETALTRLEANNVRTIGELADHTWTQLISLSSSLSMARDIKEALIQRGLLLRNTDQE
jgi:hypothetical protein